MRTRTSGSTTRRWRRPRVKYQTAKKRETHQRILRSGSHIARREGLRAASVPRVMRGAGLTTGGFYAHFHSKTAMDVEIVRTMLGPLLGLADLQGSVGLEWLHRAVKRYLSVAHRDNLDGCGYPAVLSEIASAPSEVRWAFAEALEMRVAAFQPHMPPAGVTARERALATMALTIGGLLLARAAQGSPISEEMLSACRSWALPEARGENSSQLRSSR